MNGAGADKPDKNENITSRNNRTYWILRSDQALPWSWPFRMPNPPGFGLYRFMLCKLLTCWRFSIPSARPFRQHSQTPIIAASKNRKSLLYALDRKTGFTPNQEAATLRLGRTRQDRWLPGTVRAGCAGAQQQSGASGLCEMRPDETPVLERLRATRRDQNQTNFATAAAIIRGRGQTIIVPGEPIYWFSKNHTRNCMRLILRM